MARRTPIVEIYYASIPLARAGQVAPNLSSRLDSFGLDGLTGTVLAMLGHRDIVGDDPGVGNFQTGPAPIEGSTASEWDFTQPAAEYPAAAFQSSAAPAPRIQATSSAPSFLGLGAQRP